MKLFEESSLSPQVLDAIKELGFIQPTEIQSKTIPFLLENKTDVIALAQTGTGKTAAFGLPIISQIDSSNPVPQALIICPTRELCLQIEKDFQNYCKYIPIKSVAVYGGASIDTQLKQIKQGVHIVVATPGRLVDIINRKRINLSHIAYLVLDESDEMLNMGFQEDIDSILEQTPSEKQTLLFSATMPPNVRRIANNYMNQPYEITVGTKNAGADTVSHQVYMVHSRDRYIALKRIADFFPDIYGIVFCRTRQETKDIADKLMADGYNADALHGDLSQAQRDYVMKKFRNKNLNMLVATDVAARGLDVQNLTHVINFSLPDDIEAYTHRSGRTGRAGNKGISIAIINLKEKGKIRQIEKIIQKTFEYKAVPHGAEICNAQLLHLINKIKTVDVTVDLEGDLYATMLSEFQELSKDELIQKFISFEFNRLLAYYENAPDISVAHSSSQDNQRSSRSRNERNERGERNDRRERGDRRERSERNSRADKNETRERGERNERPDRKERKSDVGDSDIFFSRKAFSRLFINIGKKNGIDKSEFIRLLNTQINDRNVQYGAIDILKSFSFFEVDKANTSQVLRSFQNANYNGIPISVEIAQAPEGKAARGSKDAFIKGDSFTKKPNRFSDSPHNRRNRNSISKRKK